MIQNETVFKFTFILIPVTAILLSVAEGFLISKLGWAEFRKAWLYAFVSNLISGFVAMILTFALIIVLLVAMSSGSVPDAADRFREGDDATIKSIIGWLFWACLAVIPITFFISKRGFLKVFQIQKGWTAWVYAFVSAVVNLTFTLAVPIIFASLYIYFVGL